MKFGNFEPTIGDWKKAKKEEKPGSIKELDQLLERLRNRVDGIYQKGEEISHEEILEIKGMLSQVPNLVINFDDTITQQPLPDPITDPKKKSKPKLNQSIALIRQAIMRDHPEKLPEFQEFRRRLEDERNRDVPFKEKIKVFYERCISGIPKEELMQVYDDVVKESDEYKEVRLNQNFFTICRHMKETRGITRVPLFVLSLNTPDLINRFYKENEGELQAFEQSDGIKVEVVAVMGNQITYDENGNISGCLSM